MKVSDIYTARDAKEYIGNSKSWRKAWLASRRKWELIRAGKRRYKRKNNCGFCFVIAHSGGYVGCLLCPVLDYCNRIEAGRGNATEVLQYLDANKKRIFALDEKRVENMWIKIFRKLIIDNNTKEE